MRGHFATSVQGLLIDSLDNVLYGPCAVPSEHAQNGQIQITLRMKKVLSGHLLFIHTFSSINKSSDSEGPDQDARMRRLI